MQPRSPRDAAEMQPRSIRDAAEIARRPLPNGAVVCGGWRGRQLAQGSSGATRLRSPEITRDHPRSPETTRGDNWQEAGWPRRCRRTLPASGPVHVKRCEDVVPQASVEEDCLVPSSPPTPPPTLPPARTAALARSWPRRRVACLSPAPPAPPLGAALAPTASGPLTDLVACAISSDLGAISERSQCDLG